MPTNVNVCINGFVLSTLMFDCCNDSGDQEGFLYGSITRNVRSEISDQSMNNTQEDILISICSSVPCGSVLSFYNNVGEINREDLEYNLGERVQNIVGWYRFRRYSAMYPSVREQAAHRNLRAAFAPNNNMDDQFFVFGLLSSSNLPNYATHSFDYAFFTQRNDSTFRNLNLTILNLGDTRNSYRSGSLALPFMNSSTFNSVLSSSWNFNTFYDTEDQIQQFHNRLRNKLDCLQEELAASDAVNATLEDDIRRISNEMQSLLAAQERMSIAAAKERDPPDTDKSPVKTQASADSNDGLKDVGTVDLKTKECTDVKKDQIDQKELSHVQAEKGSQSLKRPATEPLDTDVLTKRICPDKYFENDENQNEKAMDKSSTDSVDDTTPSSSPKDDDTVVSCLIIDPDNGELSTAQEVSAELEIRSSDNEKNMVPSPSRSIEAEIFHARLKTSNTLDCNISSSERSSRIKPPFIVYASKDLSAAANSDSSTSVKCQKMEEHEPEKISVDVKEIENNQLSQSHDCEPMDSKIEESQNCEENKKEN